MNKKIVFGALISIFIILMLPSIPAVQSNKVFEEKQSSLNQKIDQMNLDSITKYIKSKIESDDNPEPQFIGLLSIILGFIIGIFSDMTVGISVAVLGFLFGSILSITKLSTKVAVLGAVIAAMIIVGVRIMEMEE